MASSPDRASFQSVSSCRRNGGIVIQKSRKFSVKRRAPPNTPKPSRFPASMDLSAVKTLLFLIGRYISRLLADSNRLRAVRLKCKSRLRTRERGEFFEFAEQVALANLYWGIESVEKIINSRSSEAKNARLENAERMLQVPALIDEEGSTAGISNSYIICCAYFHLALVWKLRKNDWQMALHLLQAFVVSPHYSRLDFAPGVWKEIFLPCMDELESDQGIQPDELHLKKSKAHGQKDHEVDSFQICYKEALNTATRRHAKYYKDCLTYYAVMYRGDGVEESLWMDESIHTRASNRENLLEKKIGRKEANYHNQVDLQEGLYDAQPLNQEGLESSMEHAKNTDTYEGIHIGVAYLPELSAEQSFAINKGKNASCNLHIAHYKNNYFGSNSPLIEVEYCNGSTRKSGTVCHLMSNETTDPKRLLEMLREPQSDMSMSANSHSDSAEEEADTEKMTDKGSKFKAAACLSVTNMLTTDSLESTGLHSGRISYEKNDQGANFERTCSIVSADSICSPLNQKFSEFIEVATGEVCKKNSVLQDQYPCKTIKSFDDKYFDQPEVAHLTRQLLDPYKLEKLDSLQEITRSLSDFRQLSNNETPPFCTRDTCFDDHLSESLRRSDVAKLKQFGNSSRRKLDFSDNIVVYQPGNLNPHDDCEAFKKEIEFEEAICILCTSVEIKKCEEAVLVIKYLWSDFENKTQAESALLRSAVVDQLMEILLASRVEDVLRASICILSALVIKDKFIVHNILKTDPELYFVTSILKKKKIYEAVILLYLLEPSAEQMKMLELLPILVEVLYNGNHYVEGPISLPWTPRAIAVMMIEILVTSFDFLTNDSHFKTIISLKVLPGLLDILKSDNMEERVAATSILTLCMQSDGTCRHFIAQRTPITSIVQLMHGNNGRCRSVSVEFFAELIRLPRNSSITSILRQIQQHGIFSSMHILVAYIQHVSLEYQPLAAGLLLQLDMLDESQGQSIFREEAVEVLIEALSCDNLINAQISSASVLANLGGRFTYTGEPSTVVWLLKKAGLTSSKQKYMTGDSDYLDHIIQEEENDAVFWSNKMAKKIIQSGAPVFEALKQGLKSKVSEVARDCLITVAWLGYELWAMQRSCLRPIARDIILPELVAYMQPGIELEERVLASLSLYNYAVGSGMQQLLRFSKELHGPLRRLAALTWTAEELSKVIAYSSSSKFNTAWEHKQVIEIDNSMNGATLTLITYKGKLYSGHSDGSIKVWDVKHTPSHLVQEVRKHGKSVTCFALFEPRKYLISGSVDKTVRIWNGLQRILECIIVVNIKDPIHKVDTHGQMLFVVTKSLGVKVHQGGIITKVLNENKHVQSLVVAGDKIYCGCKDSSIQEIDVGSSQVKQIHGCSRTWLGKKPVYAIVPFRDWIYTAGALVEGFSLKEWRRQDGTLLSMASTGSDVQAMAVTEDFIYLKCSSSPSTIQIWMREKLQKVTSWSMGSRITSFLASNDVIFCATENGMVKAWIPT